MNVARTAADVLAEHTTLELECIDRMYLNVYVPMLQSGAGAAYFFRRIRGNPVPSSALMGPMTRRFVAAIERFARGEGVDLVRFERFERKDDRTKAYLRGFAGTEGVLYIGKAQEKARVVRTERRDDPVRGPYPWLASSTAMVNHYYVYLVDSMARSLIPDAVVISGASRSACTSILSSQSTNVLSARFFGMARTRMARSRQAGTRYSRYLKNDLIAASRAFRVPIILPRSCSSDARKSRMIRTVKCSTFNPQGRMPSLSATNTTSSLMLSV